MLVLRNRILNAIDGAEQGILPLFLNKGTYSYVLSFDNLPGVWETAEAIGIIGWRRDQKDILAGASLWLTTQQLEEGGFAPWPDISCRQSCVEPTSRLLLSLGPVQRIVGIDDQVTKTITRGFHWLLCNQDDSGGWGSYLGLRPRIFTTSFALQALVETSDLVDQENKQRALTTISRAISWLRNVVNEDGGYGTARNAPSNVCSSAHVAMAFIRTGSNPGKGLSKYIMKEISRVIPEDIFDDIGHPANNVGGRFSFRLLSKPLSLLGLLALRFHLFDPNIVKIIESILESKEDGVWKIPDGRFIWPTYFHVAALRLWCHVYSAYATASTIDLTKIGQLHMPARENMPTSPTKRYLHYTYEHKGLIFISHKNINKSFAHKLCRTLRITGYEPWIDEEQITAGDVPTDAIRKGMEVCCAAVFLLTKDFKPEAWLKHEIDLALRKRISNQSFRIIPLRFDSSIIVPEELQLLTWKDVSSEIEAVEVILAALS